MRGISQEKAKENALRYRNMYDRWMSKALTLEELGKEHDLTKQRMWQIITRCRVRVVPTTYSEPLACRNSSLRHLVYNE